jgi:hypothetical protein
MTFRPGAQVIWKPPGAVLPIKATIVYVYRSETQYRGLVRISCAGAEQNVRECELLPMLNGKG